MGTNASSVTTIAAAAACAALWLTTCWAEAGEAILGHWPLSEGKGRVAHDRSEAKHNGVIHGEARWAEERAGLNTLCLDGRDDYVEIPDGPSLDFSGDFTLSLWVGIRGGSEPTGLVVKSGTLRILYYPKGKKFLVELAGKQRFEALVPCELARGEWHCLAVVREKRTSETTLFVDGKNVARFTEPIGGLKRSPAPLRVGVGTSPRQKRFLQGAIAEVMLHARALSQKEIQAMSDEQARRLGDDKGLSLPPGDVRDSRWPLLLVDTTQIAVNDGVSLTVCEAVKHPDNPLVRMGGPGSVDEERCHFDGSVYYRDGKFRMWYWAFPAGPAYAESDDGVTWVKPDLGLKVFRGSKHNNLVPMPGRPMIFYDADEPDPQRRYKKAAGKPNPKEGGRESLWTWAYSPDGLHWTTVERPGPDKWENAESQVLTRVGKEWVIYAQGLTNLGRTVMAFHSDDLDKPVWEWQKDAVWALKDKYPLYQSHHGIKPWPRPGLTLGVYGIFHDRHELMDTTVDLGLVLSHDGLRWWEPWPLATLLRRGPAGSWDSMFLVQGGPCFVNVRDKTFLYYGGTHSGNIGGGMQVGLATLRRDGFGYLGIDIGWTYTQPGPRRGSFVTAPIRLHDKNADRVLLNVDNVSAEHKQFVTVELLDAAGRPVPGYTLADADPVTTNGIAVPATWRGSASLENMPTDIIRLRVHFQGGRWRRASPLLYAVYFQEPAEIEQ